MLDCAIDYVLSTRDDEFLNENEREMYTHFERRLKAGDPAASLTFNAVSGVLSELSVVVASVAPPPFVKERVLSRISNGVSPETAQPSFKRGAYGNVRYDAMKPAVQAERGIFSRASRLSLLSQGGTRRSFALAFVVLIGASISAFALNEFVFNKHVSSPEVSLVKPMTPTTSPTR